MMQHQAAVVGLVGLMTLSASAQDARPVQAGQEVYARYECARCHMIAGKGHKLGKLDGVGSRLSATDMRRWLTVPVEMEATLDQVPKVKMSSRKTLQLTDAEVTALVAYLMTLRK
jgi:mono/diheme cytochrome c family protein